MARMPARDAKGRFKGGRKRAAPKKRRRNAPRAAAARKTTRKRRRTTTAKRAAPRRRRNPPRRRSNDVVGRMMGAAGDALMLTGGQAVVRLVPAMLRLPRTGAVGLAISTATAVVTGLAAEEFLSRDSARIVTAGAVAVPIQQALLAYVAPRVPLVGAAVTPTLAAYPGRRELGAYPRRALPSRTDNGASVDFDYSLMGTL